MHNVCPPTSLTGTLVQPVAVVAEIAVVLSVAAVVLVLERDCQLTRRHQVRYLFNKIISL